MEARAHNRQFEAIRFCPRDRRHILPEWAVFTQNSAALTPVVSNVSKIEREREKKDGKSSEINPGNGVRDISLPGEEKESETY